MRIARIRRLALAAAAAWLPAWTGGAYAGEICEGALKQAGDSYELGLFEDVPGQLEACLKGRPSRTDLVRAQALLAKSYLAADQPEKAREAVTELLRVDPTYEPEPPPQLARLVEEVRPSVLESQVATVSKTSESLREAPATVVVIRAKEIEERGYLDLEQVLHDLPGFDISRGNGEIYSNFYQRGLRSKNNDRVLLLVDGVEQNDLATSIPQLSRQYPVSSVDRLEVIYGPASTIYGANAFSGVINIVTKQPEAFIPKGRRFGALVQAAGGSFDTRYTELALAGRDGSGSVAWSVTGRLYRSDEMDLSRFPGWSYDAEDLRKVDYKDIMELEGDVADFYCFLGFIPDCSEGPHGLYEVSHTGNGLVISLTDEGERRARERDERLVRTLTFSDPTQDWSVYAKLRLPNLTVGLQAWNREEGAAPWYSGNGVAEHGPASWSPEYRSLFLRYARSLGKNLSFNFFTRYRQSDLESEGSKRNEIYTYANRRLDLAHLVGGLESAALDDVFNQRASQSAAEATLVYSPRREFTLVSGIDLRKSSIRVRREFLGIPYVDQVVDHTDAGVYAQASYKPVPTVSLVAGGRVDYNEADSPRSQFPPPGFALDTGFGTLFTPRLALVYHPGQYAFKIIYSGAFKDPSDFEKFSNGQSGFGAENPQLEPERTRSLEVSAGWYPADGTSLELAAYQARYENIVDLLCVPDPAGGDQACDGDRGDPGDQEQFQNLLDMEVRGLELQGETRAGKASLFGNFTYIDPHATTLSAAPESGLRSRMRIGDVAGNKLNLGIGFPLWGRVGLNLRWNYVGSRRTGEGTTVPKNPLARVPAYSVANAALTYKDVVPGASLQLIVNNLLDETYKHPGVGAAEGFDLAASIPQPGRTVYLRLTWGMRSRAPEGSGEIPKP